MCGVGGLSRSLDYPGVGPGLHGGHRALVRDLEKLHGLRAEFSGLSGAHWPAISVSP